MIDLVTSRDRGNPYIYLSIYDSGMPACSLFIFPEKELEGSGSVYIYVRSLYICPFGNEQS